MKKFYVVLTILISMFILNNSVSAQTEVTNLVDAVKEEIEYYNNPANFKTTELFNTYQEYVKTMQKADLSNYEDSEDKINVYIFRGSSCPHCLDEVTWLADNYQDFKDYVNIVTYEVWNNNSNSKLMNVVAKYLKKNVSGVPFTIVGDQTFSGFSEELGASIIEEAKKLYNSEEKYDIKNYINLEDGTIIDDGKKDSKAMIILLVSIIVIGGAILIYFVSKSK